MLLDEGLHVWGSARDAARLASLAAVHPHFTPVVLDLADGAAAERAFREAAQQAGASDGGSGSGGTGGFDIVINNAGYSVFGDFAATDFAHWQAHIEVMLVNTARLAHAALELWRSPEVAAQRPKALVNVSSLAAEFPLPFQATYNVVKAGLSALSESLMVETAGTGVAVIDLRPGDYRTEFEHSIQRPNAREDVAPTQATSASQYWQRRHASVWERFARMMSSGPPPAHAAAALRRALFRRRSGTVRCGRFSQAVLAPFFVRFAPLALKRRVQARYFGL